MWPLDSSHLGSMVLVAMLSGLLGCTDANWGESRPRVNPGAQPSLASIRLLDLNGKPFDLWHQDRVSITVVVFTRSDCPVSNRFAPEICRLHEIYHPRGVDFYLVYVDPRESSETIRRHLREYEYPCQGLRDPRHTLVAYCKATTTPEAVVFNKDRAITYQGRVNDLYVELGQPRAEPTTHDLADAIESTILGRPVDTPRSKAIGCPIADLGY